MGRRLFGFRKQLWSKKKQETPSVTVLRYVQHSEFENTTYDVMQFNSNINKEDNKQSINVDKEKPKLPNKSNIKINPIEQQQTTSKEPIVSKKEKIVLNEAKPNPKNLNTTGKLKLKPIITTPNNEERIVRHEESQYKSVPSNESTFIRQVEDETYKKSTLIHMIESNDSVAEYKVHVMQHDNVSIKSENSYESAETLEAASYVNKEYSSQAASIFFAEDSDNEEQTNINLLDNRSHGSQTSA